MVRELTQKAFTLIELMAIVVIVAIFIMASFPAIQNFFERARLIAAANTLVSDLQYIRSEAIKRNVNIYVAFTPGNSWCYAYSDTAGCNCAETNTTQSTYCAANSVHYSKSYVDYSGVNLTESFTSNQILFEGLRGSVTDGLTGISQVITFSTAHYSVNININSAGLVTVCTTNEGIGRYSVC